MSARDVTAQPCFVHHVSGWGNDCWPINDRCQSRARSDGKMILHRPNAILSAGTRKGEATPKSEASLREHLVVNVRGAKEGWRSECQRR
jgi:hypothetical protein